MTFVFSVNLKMDFRLIVVLCLIGTFGAQSLHVKQQQPLTADTVRNCSEAISVGGPKLNSDCVQLCVNGERESAAFKNACGFVHSWLDSGNAKSEDCFASHIYGYVNLSGGNRKHAGYRHIDNVPSPHLCQEECQKDYPECVNFIWSDKKRSGSEPNCFLKSQEYIDRSWLGSGAFNNAWCNTEMSRICYEMEHYECVGVNTCIWCSHEWLSGPSFCVWGSSDLPQAGEDGFPICDGISDFDVTTSPDPSKPTRPPDIKTFPPERPSPTVRPSPPQPDTVTGGAFTTPTNGPNEPNETKEPNEPITRSTKPSKTYIGGTTTTTSSESAEVVGSKKPIVIGAAAGAAGLLAVATAGALLYKTAGVTPPSMEGHFETDHGTIDETERDQAAIIDVEAFQ